MGIASGEEFYDQRLALLDLDGDFLAGLQPVEKCRGGEDADVRIRLAELVVFEEDVRIEQIAQKFIAANWMADFFLERFLFVVKLGRG